MRLILASASPRRDQLLRDAGLEFEVEPANADETMDLSLGAGAIAEELALRKAALVAARHAPSGVAEGPGAGHPGAVVIGADTIVVLGKDGDPGRRFLEKAADEGEARAMLEALSGTRHRVITGVAVVPVGGAGQASVTHETTFVTMRIIRPEEIRSYVASGEWRGKAGGYAIQETADRFVEGLEGGGFDNVVGLPVAATLELLQRHQVGG